MLTQRKLSDTVSVGGQIKLDDLVEIKNNGFASVIINRPDYEEGPHQASSEDVIKLGEQIGLTIIYQPVQSGNVTHQDIIDFNKLINHLPTPIFAYCRSGTRCTILYQGAQDLEKN